MSGSSPLLQAARLWERTSAKGNRYLAGRLGGVKLLIMPNRDFAEGDPVNSHSHVMFFADGSATPSRSAERTPTKQRERPRQESPRQQIEDDAVPF